MYLYLVRHGQSVGNLHKLFFGLTDHPLTELGRKQAAEARDKLAGVPFSRCVASDLSRAYDTAAICLEGRDVPIEPDPRMREQNMGEFEDCSWDRCREMHGDRIVKMVTDWFYTTPPRGECPREMVKRVGACVDEIIEKGEDTLLVAHNGSLSLVLVHLGLADEREVMVPQRFFAHGAYTAIKIEHGTAEMMGFNR